MHLTLPHTCQDLVYLHKLLHYSHLLPGGKKVKAPKINYMKQYRKKDLNFTEKVAFFILT
jgi:hypothetical protein